MSDKNGSEGRIQWSRFFKKLSPYMIQKGLLYLKHYGPKEFWIRLHERFEPEEIPYGPWYAAYAPDQTVLDKQRKKRLWTENITKLPHGSCRLEKRRSAS